MSVWAKIIKTAQQVIQSASLADLFGGSTPPEKSVAFTIAIIALSAKIAKADGQVTRDEINAFRQVFFVSSHEEAYVARIFDLARNDVAGFESYAKQIKKMFSHADQNKTLEDILDSLFFIAGSDGVYDPAELWFLQCVADIFEIDAECFTRLQAYHDPAFGGDPYLVLGVSREASLAEIKKVWRGLVRETHPDRMLARGLPEEAIRLGTKRLIMINAAYEQISDSKSKQNIDR